MEEGRNEKKEHDRRIVQITRAATIDEKKKMQDMQDMQLIVTDFGWRLKHMTGIYVNK